VLRQAQAFKTTFVQRFFAKNRWTKVVLKA